MRRIILILIILLLAFVNLAFGTKVGVLSRVIKPAAISVDGNQVYITEGTSVHIYSLRPFKHLETFGVEGEGPGEFKSSPYLNLYPDHLFTNSPGKIMFFSRDGVFQKEIKLPFHYFYFNYPLLPVKENYACLQLKAVKQGKLRIVFEGKIYGPGFQLLKSFCQVDSPFLPPPPRPGTKPAAKIDYDVIGECVDFDAADGKIFLADSRKGFFISVFNHKGDLLYEINNKYKKIKVPEAFEEEYMREERKSKNWERSKMLYNYVFKDYYPPFFTFKVSGRKIYAVTYEKTAGRYEVVVMDPGGNVLKRSFAFPPDPMKREVHGFPPYSTTYDICKDHIYYLVEDPEAETWELHVSPVK